ncbi:hypothetical protein DB345_13670 [Spartobacteria bacterium LR76]|nr:hypothetical protein DB345_13670 [Spartobacteria bacterium LR76]
MDQELMNRRTVGIQAFSLVELLVVIAIIALLMSFTSIAITSALTGSEMERAGQTVADAIKLARQEAVSKNREVQLVLLEMPQDAFPKAWRGVEIWRIDETVNGPVTNKVSRLQRLPSQMIVSSNSALSPLLSASSTLQGTTNAAGLSGLSYRAIRFRPDGTLAGANGTTNFLTIQSARATGAPPDNYFTVSINPLTGKVTTIRP